MALLIRSVLKMVYIRGINLITLVSAVYFKIFEVKNRFFCCCNLTMVYNTELLGVWTLAIVRNFK
jgi:hypothetical protein